MARKRFSDEEILNLLRQIELSLASGRDVASACRSSGGERCDLLQLAQALRRHGPVSTARVQDDGERELPAEEDCRRA